MYKQLTCARRNAAGTLATRYSPSSAVQCSA